MATYALPKSHQDVCIQLQCSSGVLLIYITTAHGEVSRRDRLRGEGDYGTLIVDPVACVMKLLMLEPSRKMKSSVRKNLSSSSPPKTSRQEPSTMPLARPCQTNTPKATLAPGTMVEMNILIRSSCFVRNVPLRRLVLIRRSGVSMSRV